MRQAHESPGEHRYRAAFEAASAAMLVAGDDRRYLDVNEAATRLLGHPREALLRMRVEDVSPPGVDVAAQWERFLAVGEMSSEYTLVRPDGSTAEVEFHASANIQPGEHLSIMYDVSDRKRAERERDASERRLRESHDRAHNIAVVLQQAMLPAAASVPGVRVATRYRPATDALKVGGDWYDLVDLGRDRVGLAVGDVMGHGVGAAGVMGQLRSALAAAMRATGSPAEALRILDHCARSLHHALTATVMAAVLDVERRTLTYSSAGHLPLLLLGEGAFLHDGATAPPLTATPEPERRPEATVRLPDPATVVLFTDGLVERRDQDIDEGLDRVVRVVAPLSGQPCETIADRMLAELAPDPEHVDDDVALLVVQV